MRKFCEYERYASRPTDAMHLVRYIISCATWAPAGDHKFYYFLHNLQVCAADGLLQECVSPYTAKKSALSMFFVPLSPAAKFTDKLKALEYFAFLLWPASTHGYVFSFLSTVSQKLATPNRRNQFSRRLQATELFVELYFHRQT